MAKEATDTPVFKQYQIPEGQPQDPSNPIQPSATGLVLQSGEFASPNYVPGISGWKLDSAGNFEAVNGTFTGDVSANSIHAPNQTSANSMHTDSNGNSWWGANVATGYTGANAYILATGAAVFKNVQIGGTTVQYVITNSGIFSYGDNSDGSATCDGSTTVAGMSLGGGNYTLTRDVFFTNLTVNAGVTITMANFRILGNGVLTLNGTLDNSGGTGGKGGTGFFGGSNTGSAGSSGSTPGNGYFPAGPAAGIGGTGTSGQSGGGTGGAGGNITNSIGTVASGVGGMGAGLGSGGVPDGGPGGAVGSWSTVITPLKVGVQLALLVDVKLDGTTIKYGNSSGAGGGGGGLGTNLPSSGAGGGGGGGNGGMTAVYFRSIIIGAAGIIKSNGGIGGAGGDTNNTGHGPAGNGVGGGGGGGNGGVIILVYNSLSNLGSITTTLGVGGAIGTVVDGGITTHAVAGSNGSSGTVYQFQLSL